MAERVSHTDQEEWLKHFDKKMPTYLRAIDLFYGGKPSANTFRALLGMRRSSIAGEKVSYFTALFLAEKIIQDEPQFKKGDLNLKEIRKRARYPDFPDDNSDEAGDTFNKQLNTADDNFVNSLLTGVEDTLDVIVEAASYIPK